VTDIRATQVAIEQFAIGTPNMQMTQAVVEMWASVQATSGTAMIATQISLEMWAPVVADVVPGSDVRVMVMA
jgi:hypothetical protein